MSQHKTLSEIFDMVPGNCGSHRKWPHITWVTTLLQRPSCCVFQGLRACESSYSSPISIQLEHQGCWSTRAYRPRFCALTCPEGGCCSPSHTRTVWMLFRCPQGKLIQQQVMMIESCSCSISTCRQSPATAGRTVLPWLWGPVTATEGQVPSVRHQRTKVIRQTHSD